MGEYADDLIEREIRETGQRLAREAMRGGLPDPAEVRRQLPADLTLTTSGPRSGHWQVRRRASASRDRTIVAQWWPSTGRFVHGEDFRRPLRARDVATFLRLLGAAPASDVKRVDLEVPTTEVTYDERTSVEVSRERSTTTAPTTRLREPATWHGRVAERSADLLRELGAIVEVDHRPGDSKLRIIPDRAVCPAPAGAAAVLTITHRQTVHWQGHADVVAWAREPLEAHGEALASAAAAC